MLRPWNIDITLDTRSGKAIYLQIADAVIKDIRTGRLRGGDALPGSRNLALFLQVNRNTVVEAMNVLLIEGWLVSRDRKGLFVALEVPVLKGAKGKDISGSGQAKPGGGKIIQFDDGHPNSKIAPVVELARAYRQIFQRKAKWQMMSYTDEFGDPQFRAEIAQMLNHQRQMQTDAGDICITRGSQMAMYLTAQCLLTAGDYVLIEDPGYKPAWQAFEHAGAKLLPVRVDEHGLLPEDMKGYLATYSNIKALYTTPHRQYPTTVTLSLQRRMEVIELSNKYGFKIIEDDYDNEFHFGYRPVPPLSAYPELKHYVYIGTLSKVVAPALRLGYLATKDGTLMDRIGALRKIIDVQGDNIMEQAVLQLIKDGTVKRHIRRAAQYYETKRDFTVSLIKKYLGEKVSYTIPDGGLAIWIRPLQTINWPSVPHLLLKDNVAITTPEHFSYDGYGNGLRLGYGALSEEQIRTGVKALEKVL